MESETWSTCSVITLESNDVDSSVVDVTGSDFFLYIIMFIVAGSLPFKADNHMQVNH